MSIMKPLIRSILPEGGDLYWDKVVALLHFDGDLTDETGRVWTPLSGTTIDTVNPIYGKGSLLCAGLDNGCETSNPISDTVADFTIEVTVMFTALPGPVNPAGISNTWLWSQPQNSSQGEYGLGVVEDGANTLLVLDLKAGTSGLYFHSDPLELETDKKYHVAHSYESGVHRVFLDGMKVIEVTYAVGWKNTNRPFAIGRLLVPNYSQYRGGSFAKYDELRITKGVARYTENFTPPNRPFPNK